MLRNRRKRFNTEVTESSRRSQSLLRVFFSVTSKVLLRALCVQSSVRELDAVRF